mgnify:CR=1 FL=1
MAGLHDRWEARLLYGEELQLPLDDMVLPLRLRPLRGGAAQVLSLKALSRGPVSVVGAAGSGKTTWLRHLFRRLLAVGQLPLLLELRDLGRAWQDRRGSGRSLDAWVASSLRELVPEAPKDWLARLLEDPDSPPLTLLLDGWDELGELGDEVRAKLVGLHTRYHPRLQVVLTSRLVSSLPGANDGFAEHALEPLGDREMEELARRVLVAAKGDPALFIAALERDPRARELARRPLLLQMMLLLDPEERLPHRQHRLCRSCVEVLLEARGSQDADAEQLPLLEAMAARLLQNPQARGRDVAGWLPKGWSRRRKQAWLEWLTGPSGLAEERAGRVSFVHQSLLHALAAEHLHATVTDPDDRRLRFHELSASSGNGEVLRLWAALADEEEPGAAGRLAMDLSAGEAGQISLAGTLYAEGYGSADEFTQWSCAFRDLLRAGWPRGAESCAQSFARSAHLQRRRELGELLAAGAPGLQWTAWMRVREFGFLAWVLDELERPDVGLASYVVAAIDGVTLNERVVASSRFLSEGSPLWPGHPWEPALLWLWPSRRPAVGRWLQRLATLGWGVDRLEQAGASWQATPVAPTWKRGVLRYWTGDLDDDGTHGAAERWAHRLALREPYPGAIAVWAHELIPEMNLLMDEHPVVEQKPAASLLAAGLWLRSGRITPERFERVLQESRQEGPFWYSLARMLAGMASAQDREVLLQALEQVPPHDPDEQGVRGLEWGLRWVVRGDVLLSDGQILTLEELGLSLPLLE